MSTTDLNAAASFAVAKLSPCDSSSTPATAHSLHEHPLSAYRHLSMFLCCYISLFLCLSPSQPVSLLLHQPVSLLFAVSVHTGPLVELGRGLLVAAFWEQRRIDQHCAILSTAAQPTGSARYGALLLRHNAWLAATIRSYGGT